MSRNYGKSGFESVTSKGGGEHALLLFGVLMTM